MTAPQKVSLYNLTGTASLIKIPRVFPLPSHRPTNYDFCRTQDNNRRCPRPDLDLSTETIQVHPTALLYKCPSSTRIHRCHDSGSPLLRGLETRLGCDKSLHGACLCGVLCVERGTHLLDLGSGKWEGLCGRERGWSEGTSTLSSLRA